MRPAHDLPSIRLAVLAVAVALSLSGCLRAGQSVVGGDPGKTAGDLMREDAQRNAWAQFTMIVEQSNGNESVALAAYFEQMSFDRGGREVEERAECYAFQVVGHSANGFGAGGGSCTPAIEPVEDVADWSWSDTDPNRLIGSAPLATAVVEVRFTDGTSVQLQTIPGREPFRRNYLFHLLEQPVANVAEIVIVDEAG